MDGVRARSLTRLERRYQGDPERRSANGGVVAAVVHDTTHLISGRVVGDVVQSLARAAGSERQCDQAVGPEVGAELALAEPTTGQRFELGDRSAAQVRVEIDIVVGAWPRARRDEGAAGDRRAPPTVVVPGNRIGHTGRRRATVGCRAVRARPLAYVPSVVGAGLAQIDFLPGGLPHVVDEETSAGDVGIECDPEGISETPGVRLLALVA